MVHPLQPPIDLGITTCATELAHEISSEAQVLIQGLLQKVGTFPNVSKLSNLSMHLRIREIGQRYRK